MKQFNFHEAKSVKEAVKAASKNSAFLSGGQTLIPSMKLRLSSFSDVINVKNIKESKGIEIDKEEEIDEFETRINEKKTMEMNNNSNNPKKFNKIQY